MLKGIIFATAACFVWGFVFVIPGFMSSFSSFEVAIGRFAFYGLVSSLLFLSQCSRGSLIHSKSIWLRALFYSLVSNFVCYTCLVLSLRYSSPPIVALILGLSPISIALYGNSQKEELSFRALLWPGLLVVAGLLFLHTPTFEADTSLSSSLLGMLCGFCTLAIWSWYVVANSKFLKKNQEISPSDWSTMIGVSALFWALFFIAILQLFFVEEPALKKYSLENPFFGHFLIGSAILGLVCSWAGAYFWNQASLHLPVTLAGYMTVLETIFGILFVYIIEGAPPSLSEVVGIALLLSAVLSGIQIISKRESLIQQTE